MSLALRILLLLLASPAVGGVQSLSDDEVKASYVYNFLKFAEWPGGALKDGNLLTLCVMGSDSLGDVLEKLQGRKVGAHVLRVVKNARLGDDLGACRVLVVGDSLQRRAAAIIKEIGDAPVLTISNIEGFAEKGGCIGLTYRDDRMLFEVNLEALRKKNLQLPAQVLNLAANVYGR